MWCQEISLSNVLTERDVPKKDVGKRVGWLDDDEHEIGDYPFDVLTGLITSSPEYLSGWEQPTFFLSFLASQMSPKTSRICSNRQQHHIKTSLSLYRVMGLPIRAIPYLTANSRGVNALLSATIFAQGCCLLGEEIRQMTSMESKANAALASDHVHAS